METINIKDKMYMGDGESYIITEFDFMDESLRYTLDFNTKGGASIFSNVYNLEHPHNTWTINIDKDDLFYPALLELFNQRISLTYKDKRNDKRSVSLRLEDDMSISVVFEVPNNKYNLVNIKISEQDPNYDLFINLINTLNNTFENKQIKNKKAN